MQSRGTHLPIVKRLFSMSMQVWSTRALNRELIIICQPCEIEDSLNFSYKCFHRSIDDQIPQQVHFYLILSFIYYLFNAISHDGTQRWAKSSMRTQKSCFPAIIYRITITLNLLTKLGFWISSCTLFWSTVQSFPSRYRLAEIVLLQKW